MKRIFLIVSLVLIGAVLTCCFAETQHSAVALLRKYAPFKDTNPTHQEDADKVNNVFIRALESLGNYAEDEKANLRMKVFLLLYDNSVSPIFSDDSADANRKAIRRSLCFMTLALLSDRYRYDSFITDAMSAISIIHVPESKYRRIALIKLLEILLMYHFKDVNPKEIIEEKRANLYEFINSKKDYLSENFVNDFISWHNMWTRKDEIAEQIVRGLVEHIENAF